MNQITKIFLVTLVVTMVALATPIPLGSTFSVVGSVHVSNTYIDWSTSSLTFDAVPIGGTTIGYSQAAGGGLAGSYFFGLPAGTGGATELQMFDLTTAAQPVGVPISVPGFIQVKNVTGIVPPPAFNTLTLNLTKILAGGGCVGYSSIACTALASTTTPFNLVVVSSDPNSTTVIFDVLGNMSNGADTALFTGRFSSNFSGTASIPKTPDYILGTIASNGFILAGFSGNITADETGQIPEPATTSMMLLGGGLLGAVGLLKKFRAKK